MSPKENQFPVMYYVKAAAAGGICCSITHGAVTPLDVVKTRIQLDPIKYNKGFIGGFKQVIQAEGPGEEGSGDHRVLGVEVVQQTALGYSGSCCDVLERHFRQALVEQHLLQGVEDSVSGVG